MRQHLNHQHPFAFFLLVIGFTWTPWLTAVTIGQGRHTFLGKLLLFIGLLGPTLAALILVYTSNDNVLRKDYWRRVFNAKLITPGGYLFIFFMAPILASLAVVISTVFGRSFAQFHIVSEVRNNALMIVPFILSTFMIGPLPEELDWRGYWLDSLRTKFTGVVASIILGCVWSIWHIPLFFVKSYPLQEHTSNLFMMVVFFTDMAPKAVIYTYVFYKNNRSTCSAILFHFMGNFTGMIIEIDPFTECIQMILVCVVASVLVLTNKGIYLYKPIRP